MAVAKFLRGHQVRSLRYFWLHFPHKLFALKTTKGNSLQFNAVIGEFEVNKESQMGSLKSLYGLKAYPSQEKSPL